MVAAILVTEAETITAETTAMTVAGTVGLAVAVTTEEADDRMTAIDAAGVAVMTATVTRAATVVVTEIEIVIDHANSQLCSGLL
jgi:hypothetical protein